MKTTEGFTLVEILLSVGILAIVATLLAQVLFTTTHVNTKTEILTGMKEDGNFALGIMERMVRMAVSVETTCAQGEVSANGARITNPDTYVTTLTCRSDGSAARIASVSGVPETIVYLSQANATLSVSGGADCTDSSLAFSCPPADGGVQSELVVTFILGKPGVAGSAYESGSAAFSGTIRTRK